VLILVLVGDEGKNSSFGTVGLRDPIAVWSTADDQGQALLAPGHGSLDGRSVVVLAIVVAIVIAVTAQRLASATRRATATRSSATEEDVGAT